MQAFPYGAVELKDPVSQKQFKVNEKRVKPYLEGLPSKQVVEKVNIENPH